MARPGFSRRPLILAAALGAVCGGMACLGGCSSHPTQRAALEHRTLVIEPSATSVSATPASFNAERGPTALSSVPTD